MKKYSINKKYFFAVTAGLLTTAAVTATVLATNKPVNGKAVVKKEVKNTEKKSSCTKASSHHLCPFSS